MSPMPTATKEPEAVLWTVTIGNVFRSLFLKNSAKELETLKDVLSWDPRPQTQIHQDKVFGMPYGEYDIRFRVQEDTLTVIEVV